MTKKKTAPEKLVTIAVLDGGSLLVGFKQIKESEAGGEVVVPDCCDLPTDGQYRWDAKRGRRGQFIPVGAGHGKPERPPIAPDYAQFLAMRALVNGTPVPKEVSDYVEWYEKNRLKMMQETAGRA